MKTIETLAAVLAESCDAYRETAQNARKALKELETVYRETIDRTPAETIAAYINVVGYDVAVSIIATLTNASAWDGRISASSARWAAQQGNAYDAEAAERLWLHTDRIHKAHLDQLAAAMMEYKPEEPAKEPADEPADEPAQNVAERITEALSARKDRSAWNRGVNEYALELAENLRQRIEYEGENPWSRKELEKWLLDGASDWMQYSCGGCSMIYNGDIAERLCTPSELRKTDNGRKDPNPRESWLECQARALYQAAQRVCEEWSRANSEEIPLF